MRLLVVDDNSEHTAAVKPVLVEFPDIELVTVHDAERARIETMTGRYQAAIYDVFMPADFDLQTEIAALIDSDPCLPDEDKSQLKNPADNLYPVGLVLGDTAVRHSVPFRLASDMSEGSRRGDAVKKWLSNRTEADDKKRLHELPDAQAYRRMDQLIEARAKEAGLEALQSQEWQWDYRMGDFDRYTFRDDKKDIRYWRAQIKLLQRSLEYREHVRQVLEYLAD